MALFGESTEAEAISALYRGKTWLTAVTVITQRGKTVRRVRRLKADRETVPLRRQLLQQCYYLAATEFLDTLPAWGALAGVRPTKLSTRHLLSGGTEKSAHKLLKDVYFVTGERRQLAVDCSVSTVKAERHLRQTDVSLYVGIPFCPTRCAYCSFVSRTVGRQTERIAPYLEALKKEIAHTGKLLEKYGRTVRTLYIGGGTPTTLTSGQLGELLGYLKEHIDLSQCLEFTVEGGRPDTLSYEKLKAIFDAGADRMSINPQSMEQNVLKACGRPHTPEEILDRYQDAVKAGFSDINMDLIAGLPEDTYAGFCRSLEQVAALRPANITVHTLALKKGADLFEKRQQLPAFNEVAAMVEYANSRLRALGYKPYYLYRQKYMSGSFENVGWSRDGRDCLYNIYMMEERHTVISLGGGGMNKVNLPDGTLQRFHNPKFPEEYIRDLDKVLKDKEELFGLM